MKPLHIAAFAIWAVLAMPVAAQNLDAGWDAYEAGDYATALKNWQPLAEQGNAFAQSGLGLMYDTGQGVPQDYVLAHMWFNIASVNGIEEATRNRALAAERTLSLPRFSVPLLLRPRLCGH